MAAMAQLDCGACGYLCQTYAEAIARGEEKDLTRCTPGGKDTVNKLKELVAAKAGHDQQHRDDQRRRRQRRHPPRRRRGDDRRRREASLRPARTRSRPG